MIYKLFLTVFALIILFPTSHVFGIHVYLKGGNVLVGELPETLPFSTPISNLKIKSSEIVSFEKSRLKLKNGSVLQDATIELEDLQIQTKFGQISIKVGEIEIIEEMASVQTHNNQQKTISNKYLIVTNEKGVILGDWNLPKGTRLTIVSEEGNHIKAMLGEDTFDLTRNGEVIRNFKIEDITTPPNNGVGQGKQALTSKKTIAVATFDNRVPIAGGGEYSLSRGMSDQLNHALVKSGRFIVLSRGLFEEMAAEKDIAATYSNIQSGYDGTIPWSQILIKGTITEFDPGIEQSGEGYAFMGIEVQNTKAEAHVAVIIQIVDTSTGQIIDSYRAEGITVEGGATFEVNSSILTAVFGSFVPGVGSIPNISTRQETFKKAPLGKATQICIEKAVKYICQKFAEESWQGAVMKVKGKKVYINSGSSEGIKPGMVLCVCQGSTLLDPHSRVNLGMDLEEIGKLKVIKVSPKFSECFLIEGYEPKIGDIVTDMSITRVVDSPVHGSGDDDTVWAKLEKLKREKEEGIISEEDFNNLLEILVPGR